MCGRGREREKERIPSRLCTISAEPDVGLEHMNCEIMTQAEVGRLTDGATQVPTQFLKKILYKTLKHESSWCSPALFSKKPEHFTDLISLILTTYAIKMVILK